MEKTVEADKTVEEFTDYPTGNTATDNAEGDIKIELINNTVNMGVPGEYYLRYKITDANGNVATNKIFIYVVDNTPPTISLIGDDKVQVEINSGFDDPGLNMDDNAIGELTTTKKVYYSESGKDGTFTDAKGNEVDTSVLGTYTIWYTVTDESGNSSQEMRIVEVVDNTPPTISLEKDYMEVEINTKFKEPEIKVEDNSNGKITINRVTVYYSETGKDGTWDTVEDKEINTSKLGYYNINYTATDESGNTSESVRLQVKIVDNTPPTISLEKDYMEVEINTEFKEPEPKVEDNSKGNTTISKKIYYSENLDYGYTEKDEVATSKLGYYTIWYTATDESGNTSESVRLLIKIVDNTPPTISLEKDYMEVEINTEFKEPGLKVEDNSKGNTTINKTIYYSENLDYGYTEKDEVNTSKLGYYTIWYSATDESGNTCDSVRLLIKIVDNDPPTISLEKEYIEVKKDTEFKDPEFNIKDNSNGKITINRVTVYYSETGKDGTWGTVEDKEVVTSKLGYYNINYTATDEAGNTSGSVRLQVKIVE